MSLSVIGLLVLAACSAGGGSAPIPVTPERAASDFSPDASATPPVTPSPTAAPNDPGSAYLALGDSVAFGIGVTDPRADGYPARVDAALAEIQETRVFAVPGQTAAGFLEIRIDDVERAIAELEDRVELVTVGLGANELLRMRREPACLADQGSPACAETVRAAIAVAEAALDGVVARIQTALEAVGADAQVLVLAYYNPDVGPIAAASVVGTDGRVACDPEEPGPGLNDRIACVASQRGAVLVDLHAAFLGRVDELTNIGRGDIHPNAAGYAVIADTILDMFDSDR